MRPTARAGAVAVAVSLFVAGGLWALRPHDDAGEVPGARRDPRLAWAPRGDAALAWSDADGGAPSPAARELSVLTLLEEMADLAHLAREPVVPFVAKQASSYDRRSKRPQEGEPWFANDDFATNAVPNLVRVETTPQGERRFVLLDARGPGAVVRLWTATPAGVLRIYIDDDARPALEAPMGPLLAGQIAPFQPPFGEVTAMGHSLYFPFPFAKRCLVTIDTLDSQDPFSGRTVDKVYYQIGYRAYAAEAAPLVRPFSAAEVVRARATLARVGAALVAPPGAVSGSVTRTIAHARVDETHPSVTTVERADGGAIRSLRLTTNERDPERLGATLVTLSFDGEETVQVPLMELFGTGPGWNAYRSLPLEVGADGTLTSRFVMPFERRAVLTISRAAAPAGQPAWPPLDIEGSLEVSPWSFGEDSLLFHAGFRPRARLATRPFRDWHLGTLEGRGHQVGTVLSVLNPPGVFWWGEGDEKIFVDGETFPGIFGTGTEDYFGYAWSSIERFAHPYHAQTLAPAQGFAGWFSMNRFLVLDPVPFRERLRFDMELWHWSDTTVEMAATLFWYAGRGGRDDLARRAAR